MQNVYSPLAAVCLCLTAFSISAQRQGAIPIAEFGTFQESGNWIDFFPAANVSSSNLWSRYGEALGLGAQDGMQFVSEETDRIGWTHVTFQQIHNGIPVEFALFKVHEKNGLALKGNGEIARDIVVNTIPSLSEDQALAIALGCVGATTYNWEVPEMEARKQYATGDPSATFYPAGKLIIADRDFNDNNPAKYKLTWKFEIYAHDPESRSWIYVDATTGEIWKELNLDMHESGFPGVAETRYSGVREIVADSTENGFILRDRTRGRGVETYDMGDSTDVDHAMDFVDDDNYWDNANDRADDAATDAHWAAEQLYDYLLSRHDFHGYNNRGDKLISYVHHGQNWRNASWNGFWCRYGDADGDPWTHVDVVGHEFAHGITWATAGLVYDSEPGALNESFSDIMGETLQHYTNGGITDWLATPAPVDTIRSYRNPNDYGDPDTYLGDFWEFGPIDNNGVHTNSGVQNYWFYLLSNGGEGTNDNGDEYSVDSIGIEKAFDIVFRNLRVYLNPLSDYFDARQGSLNAAADLFGLCSEEYRQVGNAWHAVGVGERVEEVDFAVTGIENFDMCIPKSEEFITLKVKHFGCDSTGPVNIIVKLIKTNPPVQFTDTIEIPEGVLPGEEFDYTFPQPFSFSRKGEHSLTTAISTEGDLNTGNDQAETEIIYNLAQISKQEFPFHTRTALRTYRDSIAFITGSSASMGVKFWIGRDSTHGIRIEGSRARLEAPVHADDDPFAMNERYKSKMCFCVDATELDSLGFQYDLLQWHSRVFDRITGLDNNKSCAVRVVIDTNELIRHYASTPFEDEWMTHYLDLEAYLGNTFNLCIEASTILSQSEDDSDTLSMGDVVFLDNIEFTSSLVESGLFSIAETHPLEVYPNPAQDEIFIRLPQSHSSARIRLLNPTGQVLFSAKYVATDRSIDTSGLPPGMYFIEAVAGNQRMLGRVVLAR